MKVLTLTLHLTSTNKSVDALLGQEIKGVKHPLYYLSRSLREAVLNYFLLELYCLALIFATQKLFHYLLAHCLNLVTKSNHLKYLLSRPVMSGRILLL